jgi:protein gp37
LAHGQRYRMKEHMSKNSSIEWTHHTFNPWWGCTKISAGCDNCYAANLSKRYHSEEIWGPHAKRRFMSHAHWDTPIAWNNEAKARRQRERVFCASMADVFEVRHDLARHRLRLLNLIAGTRNLDWLLLTKRPHSIKKLLPLGYQFPRNVWLGVSVEDQERADKRIPYLQAFPTPAVRFLSCEPLLGPIDIRRYLQPGRNGVRIDWVICGGESEHGARPMNPEWAEHLLAQCQEAGVPFFFKQWGTWGLQRHLQPSAVGKRQVVELFRQDGSPVELVRVGKKAAGSELNGCTWTQFPSRRETL